MEGFKSAFYYTNVLGFLVNLSALFLTVLSARVFSLHIESLIAVYIIAYYVGDLLSHYGLKLKESDYCNQEKLLEYQHISLAQWDQFHHFLRKMRHISLCIALLGSLGGMAFHVSPVLLFCVSYVLASCLGHLYVKFGSDIKKPKGYLSLWLLLDGF